MSVTAGRMRELVGRRVRLRLAPAWGGGELRGRVSRCLESADGLVVFLEDDAGRPQTVHYQHIEAAEPEG